MTTPASTPVSSPVTSPTVPAVVALTAPMAAPSASQEAGLANARTLTANLATSQGLPLDQNGVLDFGALTYDQRIAFNRAFATFVASHPQSFTSGQLATANIVLGEHPSALSDVSLSADVKAFGSGVLDDVVAAGVQVAGVGRGVLNLAGAASWLIPIAGVALLVFWLMGQKRKLA